MSAPSNALLRCAMALAAIAAGSVIFANAAEIFIVQRAIHFSQKEIAVRPGDTVRYHNEDDVTHHLMVTGDEGDPEDHGLQHPGMTTIVHFTKEGTFEVRCAIHPRMKMTVTVIR